MLSTNFRERSYRRVLRYRHPTVGNNLPGRAGESVRRRYMKLRCAVGLFGLFLLVGSGSGQQQMQSNGYWWDGMNPSFKLGWVSGYAKAMDSAGSTQIATCAANLPMYQKQFPNIEP